MHANDLRCLVREANVLRAARELHRRNSPDALDPRIAEKAATQIERLQCALFEAASIGATTCRFPIYMDFNCVVLDGLIDYCFQHQLGYTVEQFQDVVDPDRDFQRASRLSDREYDLIVSW